MLAISRMPASLCGIPCRLPKDFCFTGLLVRVRRMLAIIAASMYVLMSGKIKLMETEGIRKWKLYGSVYIRKQNVF